MRCDAPPILAWSRSALPRLAAAFPIAMVIEQNIMARPRAYTQIRGLWLLFPATMVIPVRLRFFVLSPTLFRFNPAPFSISFFVLWLLFFLEFAACLPFAYDFCLRIYIHMNEEWWMDRERVKWWKKWKQKICRVIDFNFLDDTETLVVKSWSNFLMYVGEPVGRWLASVLWPGNLGRDLPQAQNLSFSISTSFLPSRSHIRVFRPN